MSQSFYDNEFNIPVPRAIDALQGVRDSLSPKMAEQFDDLFSFFAANAFEASALEFANHLHPGTQDPAYANKVVGSIAHAIADYLGFQKSNKNEQYQVALMTHWVEDDRGTVWTMLPCFQAAWRLLHPGPVPASAPAVQAAFLYTWSQGPKGQGNAGISGLKDGAVCDWPIKSFRLARTGDAFVLLKQGIHDNPGIMGYGSIINDRKHEAKKASQPRPYRMDIVFTRFRHPEQGLLLTQDELIELGFPDTDFLKQGSGHPMHLSMARTIIDAIEAKSLGESLPPERREALREEQVRNRAHILALKQLAGGRCQLTGEQVANGLGGDLTEGHHIKWLSLGGPDTQDNIVILSPDMHALVHRPGTVFDWSSLSFIVNGTKLPLRIELHLKRVPGNVTENSSPDNARR